MISLHPDRQWFVVTHQSHLQASLDYQKFSHFGFYSIRTKQLTQLSVKQCKKNKMKQHNKSLTTNWASLLLRLKEWRVLYVCSQSTVESWHGSSSLWLKDERVLHMGLNNRPLYSKLILPPKFCILYILQNIADARHAEI